MNLGLLFFDEADEFVVLLDGFERLDVDGLAGGTGAVDDAGDAALELAADGDDEAVAADGDEVFLGGAVAGKLAQCGAKGFFDDALLALLLAADAAEFGRGIVGQRAVGLNRALDGFGERLERRAGERDGELREAGELAGKARGRLSQQCLPGSDVVGEAGDGLEFGGFEGCAGDLRLGGELRGVEQAAERDGYLLGEEQADLAGELMLAGDPWLVGRGPEREDGLAADGRGGIAGRGRRAAAPIRGRRSRRFRRETGWDRAEACTAFSLPGLVK